MQQGDSVLTESHYWPVWPVAAATRSERSRRRLLDSFFSFFFFLLLLSAALRYRRPPPAALPGGAPGLAIVKTRAGHTETNPSALWNDLLKVFPSIRLVIQTTKEPSGFNLVCLQSGFRRAVCGKCLNLIRCQCDAAFETQAAGFFGGFFGC